MAFEPGQSGNPAGTKRPKRFMAALERALAQDDGERLRQCAEKLFDLAAAGEPWAVKELADRFDGKSHQSVDVGGTDGAPLLVQVIRFNDASDPPATR